MNGSASEQKQSAVMLHTSAEAELASRPIAPTPELPIELLLHENQVHEIERMMQNEELHRMQEKATAVSLSSSCFLDSS